MSRFDAILCDVDGCLISEGQEAFDVGRLARVAAWNVAAARARDRPVLTLCTGRPQAFAEAICRLVANTSLPCIAENGAWLYDPGANRYELDPSITRAHLREIARLEAWVRERLEGRGVAIQPGKIASVSLYHPDTSRLLGEVREEVQGAIASLGLSLRVSHTERYLNCDLAHVSKASAIDRWMERTAIGRERMAGIGDAAGDRLIRERVAWFACPSNGVEELRATADYVSTHPLVEGVLDILERLAGSGGPAAHGA